MTLLRIFLKQRLELRIVHGIGGFFEAFLAVLECLDQTIDRRNHFFLLCHSNIYFASCAIFASLKNFSRVAMTFIGASVKYEYEGDRERSDKGSTAQSADSHWRLRNPRAHDRQVPCARRREHWRVPFRLSARQHAFRLQRGEGRRFQSTNRKRRERSGDGRVAQSQRRKENPR